MFRGYVNGNWYYSYKAFKEAVQKELEKKEKSWKSIVWK